MSDIKEGIYLEAKEVTLGTGHTARTTRVRNLYAVRRGEGGKLELFLLDEKLRPTGVREQIGPEELAQRMVHMAKLDAAFAKLKVLLDRLPPPAPPKPKTDHKPQQQEQDKGKTLAWWELTQKGADHLLKK